MKIIKVECKNCKTEFDKLKKEYNRCVKNGMNHFCSRSCSCYYRNENMPDGYWKNCKTSKNLQGHTRLNEYSPFRTFFKSGRVKNVIKIDVKYLKCLWESQNGICPYTGIKMILPETSKLKCKMRSLTRASLDRIDSSKEYIEGNVEFVCFGINLAKNNFKKEEMIEFIKLIKCSGNTLSVTQLQPT